MHSHWLTRTRTIRRLWVGFVIALAFTVLGEYLVDRHPHFTLDRLPGFNAIYGFLACAALILFAKLIGLPLKRADTYYEDGQNE
jgi:hypothetical protein